MAVRTVACSSCKMWEIRETSSVHGDYTCEKCTWMQLLTDCIRELELELNALRIIRGTENIIDKSDNEVVTRKVQSAESWVTTRRDKGEKTDFEQGNCTNRFTVLDTVGWGGVGVQGMTVQGLAVAV
eukprot:g42731.t1